MLKNHHLSLNNFFKITILIKGVDGLFDVITSLFFWFASPDLMTKIIPWLLRKELIEDPKDILANYTITLSQNILPDTRLFIIIYLAIHGLIKIGLALALNTKNYIAYKISEIILILFVIYQIYRFLHTYSLTLFMFTLLDIIIIFFIQKESKKLLDKTSK